MTEQAANITNAPVSPQLTFGEKAVGLKFNPGGSDEVEQCKKAYAAMIDRLNTLRSLTDNHEMKRMYSTAITELQTSQMWAVKAITWQY